MSQEVQGSAQAMLWEFLGQIHNYYKGIKLLSVVGPKHFYLAIGWGAGVGRLINQGSQ